METSAKHIAETDSTERRAAEAVARVSQALRGLRFGEVRIVVHEGAIVQVERTEKLRLSPARRPSAA